MAEVAPSLLAADFANLARDIERVEEAGAGMIHLDVMDGHFVPNLTIGLPVVEAIRRSTELFLDVHLMITNPEEMAVRFAEAGADSITVHYEAATHLHQILSRLHKMGVSPGVVLNPHSPVYLLEECLDLCDMVLLMSVNPGYGGQDFISSSYEKVRKLRKLIQSQHLNVKIEMDGGIGPHNAGDLVRAGVDVLVAGTAIFSQENPAEAFQRLQGIVAEAESQRS